MRCSIDDVTVTSIVFFMILIIGIYIYLGVEFVFASVRHILLCKDR